MDFRTFVPGDHRLSTPVGKERRDFRLHIPKDFNPRLNPVIAFDGVTLWNQEGSMGHINGLDHASDTHKFAAIYPVPKVRYFGIVAGWNAPGAYLSYRSSYNDVDFVKEIFHVLQLERAYLIGFSAGAQFAHLVAGSLSGVIAGVGSVCGTWLGTEPNPPPGTALLAIHGDEDTVLPYAGGGRGFKVKLLSALGNHNVTLSKPANQARVYAAANGYELQPSVDKIAIYEKQIVGSDKQPLIDAEGNPVFEYTHIPFEEHGDPKRPRALQSESSVTAENSTTKLITTYEKRTFGREPIPVIEYIIQGRFGGHTYHGRHTGAGTESVLSGGHGRPLPAKAFSTNDLFAVTMGLTELR